MLRSIRAIVLKDLKNGFRDNLIVYFLISPLLMVLLLKLFWPVFSSVSINLVVDESVDKQVVSQLEEYAKVQVVEGSEELYSRVNDFDDTAGIIQDADGFSVIIQGNESHEVKELPGMVLNHIAKGNQGYNFTFTDVYKGQPPAWDMMVIFILLTTLLVGGMVMALSIIEERQFNINSAMNASPVTKGEYIAGKSMQALLVSIFLVVAVVWVLEIKANYLLLLLVSLSGVLLAVILGFVIGVMSEDQISGIANIKAGAILFIFLPIIGLLVPAAYRWTMYWVPTFWLYQAYDELIIGGNEYALGLSIILTTITSLALIAVSFRFLKARI